MYNSPTDSDGNNHTTPTGERIKLNGLQYLSTKDHTFQENNPEASAMMRYRYNATDQSLPYRTGGYLRDVTTSPSTSTVGKIFNKGPLMGALAGGIPAAAIGYLAGVIRDRMTGSSNAGTVGLTAGAIGSALGGLSGYLRKESSVMYKDPRNFIMEKLQDANDIDLATRMRLAIQVRNMDKSSAGNLASMVRQACGFGVGAIIAKYLLGASFMGTVLGGLMGMGVSSYLGPNSTEVKSPTYF